MTRRLFLHIGPQKTGTSSLQQFMDRERKRLLARGVLYPDDNAHNWWSHHRLGFALRGVRDPKNGDIPDPRAELADTIRQFEQSGAHTMVLSSEEFFALRPEAINLLREAFTGYECRIVLYARRQDDAFVSSYTQKVKSARRRFVDPIHSFLNDPTRLSTGLDFLRRTSNWADAFGKEAIVIRFYDDVDDIRIDFTEMLSDETLVQLARKTDMESANRGPTLEAIEHIRAFKSVVDDYSLYGPARNVLTDHFAASGQKPGNLLSTDDRRRILEYFRSSNERFFAKFSACGNRFDPDHLLAPEETGRVTVDTSRAVPLVMELLARNGDPSAGRKDTSPLSRLAGVLPAWTRRS